MKIVLCLFLVFSSLPIKSYSQASKSVVGIWKYHHSVGSPCKELIADLNYHFFANGEYSADAKMRNMGKLSDEHTKGTYKINGNTITTQVGDITIGPLAYRFENEYLIFEQKNPSCDVYLILEDY